MTTTNAAKAAKIREVVALVREKHEKIDTLLTKLEVHACLLENDIDPADVKATALVPTKRIPGSRRVQYARAVTLHDGTTITLEKATP
jgi:hypothetical protein